MAKLTFTVDNKISGQIKSIERALNALPRQAYDFFKSKTPIRTGNARRRTKLQGDVIAADYPYAQRLDEGYSSQAPDGMSQPTEEFVAKRIREILRNKK